MTYEEARGYIDKTKRFGSKPGLSRIRALLSSMGDPQNRMKYVHVAGTNGKGSTSAMIASVLRTAGYKTGLYISPYVVDFLERIQLDGEKISEEDFAFHVSKIASKVEKLCREGLEQPTEFEILTAIAFDYYACKGCDFVSLEVGLGGRFDATNVINAPEVAVLCSISFDHTEYLGDTIEKIAFEKCGIIKEGSDVVVYASHSEPARRVIKNVCEEKKIVPVAPDLEKLVVLSQEITGSEIRYGDLRLSIPLAGAHQILNALTAVEAARALIRRGFSVSDEQIAEGIGKTVFPGRLETVRKDPVCIIDGAHNRDGIAVLASEIDRFLKNRRLITVMGMLRDKEYTYCIPQIASRSDLFIAVTPDNPRALDASEAALCAGEVCKKVLAVPDVGEAVSIALKEATGDDVVLVCGSLYILGHAKSKLLGK